MTKKPFILTSVGLGIFLIWNVVSGLLSQIHWGSVGGCVAGYMATDWITSLLNG